MKEARIAKWDNVKFFMILCVVTGHTLYEFIGDHTETAKSIYLFIYTFHIPVLIFVSGLFSKHAVKGKKYERVIQYLCVYLVMKLLDYLGSGMTSYTRREDFISLKFFGEIRKGLMAPRQTFHLFWEDGPGWFALAIAVYILATILLQEVNRRVLLTAALMLGCLAGLDNHLGDHLASMRICTFYPVFLMGYYMDPGKPRPKRISEKILSAGFLVLILLVCLIRGDELYNRVNFLKGKTDYMSLGMGANGVILRLICYGFWILIILAIVLLAPRKEYFWTWLGTRTMSIFIWHKFILTILLKLCYGKYFIQYEMPHLYMFAAICVAVIVTVLSAYLPEFRISRLGEKSGGQ